MVTAQPVVAAQPVAQPYVQQPYGARGYEQQAHYGQPVVAQPVAGPGPPGPGPVGPDGRRPTWSSGICDCFMQCSPSCLMGFFCPCFQFARIKKTENIEGCPGDSWGLNCCCYFIVSFLSGLLPSNLLLFILGVIGTIGRTWMLATLRLQYVIRSILRLLFHPSPLVAVFAVTGCDECTRGRSLKTSSVHFVARPVCYLRWHVKCTSMMVRVTATNAGKNLCHPLFEATVWTTRSVKHA